ncbi:MAG TPA: family 1 glycosylhydrolase [Thermoanaerobaculia bacterium]|nr:family 1 glycosylhydrolase [Thermoanaerobaculia bacterium]
MTGIAPRFPFPDRPRLWGVAVSHYQVEGDDSCDWTEWERSGRAAGGTCGGAAGAWSRYEHDANLASESGANAFRFSVSWSRIEPHPGVFDHDALARYRRFVEHLIGLGIEPVVTLFHYTHPFWLHETAPWTTPAAVDRFERFSRHVARALGDLVRYWIPINEPMVFLLAGFLAGQIPPGLSSPRILSRVFDHLLAAHCAAAAAIRDVNPSAAIGTAHNMMAFTPQRPYNPLDLLLAGTADSSYNLGIIEAFGSGRWRFLLPPATIIAGRRDELPSSLDVFGVNFYSRLHLRCPGRRRAVGDFSYLDPLGRGLTDNGWEMIPEAFSAVLDQAATSGKPIVVTENGLADAGDRYRPKFLRAHAAQLDRAAARGNPIHGYFHWSLLDNFEWLEGYGPKFGLYEVDRSTMERKPRPSADVFRVLGKLFLNGASARA